MPQGNSNDAFARQNGFENYEQMRLFAKNRMVNAAAPTAPGTAAQSAVPPASHMANYLTPFGIIQMIADKFPNVGVK